MLKLFISLSLCYLAIGWIINANNTCTCGQMKIELDCDLNGCFWNQETCQPFSCAGLPFETCRQTSNCYYDSTECADFTSCSAIKFDSAQKCWDAKSGCYYYSGNTCSEFSCSKYTTANCPAEKCFISGEKCAEQNECAQYEMENCPFGNWCIAVSIGEASHCRQMVCSDLVPSSGRCLYVYVPKTNSIIPCITQGEICVAAQNATDLDSPALCAYNTDGLYHWSSDSATDGICEACSSDPPGPGPDPVPKQSIIMLIGTMLLLGLE